MKKIGTLEIVGVPYTLFYYEDEFKLLNDNARTRDERYGKKKPEDENIDGYCDYSSKEIHIFSDKYTSPEYFEMTLRHEITHAYLYEIGNANCNEEELVDKVSKWVVPINKIANTGLEMIRDAKNQEESGSQENNQ